MSNLRPSLQEEWTLEVAWSEPLLVDIDSLVLKLMLFEGMHSLDWDLFDFQKQSEGYL